MEELDGYVLAGRHAVYRPAGRVSFDEVVDLVRSAIARARADRVRDLLVDTTELFGFSSPDTLQRFLAVVAWAAEAQGSVRLAMVTRAEMIDPGRFGVTVAANRGLESNIFTNEADARAWLKT